MCKSLVCIVLGTRPEAIKLAPVILRFLKSDKFSTKLISTGQHKDMVAEVMETFQLKIDIDLNIMKKKQSLEYLTSETLNQLVGIFDDLSPSLTLVQGDTSSAFAAALAAFYCKVPVGHVEAGLRTNNFYAPFPEEINRRLISQLATYNFAPTQISLDNLKQSNTIGENFLTGNTIVDALRLVSKRASKPIFMNKIIKNSRIIFATIHRRENWGINLNNFSLAIRNIINSHRDTFLIMPMHPNKIVRQALKEYLEGYSRILLIEPLPYEELVYILRESYLVITDSGGLQEEAPTFGKPVLVFRETTEREELIALGSSKLVGTSAESLEKYANELLTNKNMYKKMSKVNNPFGDGFSAERIFDICSSKI